MNHLGSKVLHTERLTLRPFGQEDAQAMFRNWASDADATEYVTWYAHSDMEVTQSILKVWTAQYLEKPDHTYKWAIQLEGVVIGDISLVTLDESIQSCEVGYIIGKAYWGQGIVTEALGRVLAFLFDEVGMNRVFLRHDVRNPASGRVMEKNGLTHEGIFRESFRRKDGSLGDMANYAILRSEWEARKTT